MSPCKKRTSNHTIRQGDSLQSIAKQYRTTVNAITDNNPGVDLNNLYAGQKICICPEYGYNALGIYPANLGISKAEDALSKHLRMLWEQHVFWTRQVIVSIVFGLPDVDLVTNRLLRNPRDFEAALAPLYGGEAAARFAALFTDHLVIAAQLVKAAKAGNSREAADAEMRWYANANEIAAFLGSINPFWSERDWRAMLHAHLALTKAEAVTMLTGNYGESIALFDKIERQALKMADTMTCGIVKQFPGRFA